MELTVNGLPKVVPAEVTVADVVAEVTDRSRGVAVAVNGEVVPRTDWLGARLRAGDRVEVLIAAQGG